MYKGGEVVLLVYWEKENEGSSSLLMHRTCLCVRKRRLGFLQRDNKCVRQERPESTQTHREPPYLHTNTSTHSSIFRGSSTQTHTYTSCCATFIKKILPLVLIFKTLHFKCFPSVIFLC